jgi:hypothetical protein
VARCRIYICRPCQLDGSSAAPEKTKFNTLRLSALFVNWNGGNLAEHYISRSSAAANSAENKSRLGPNWVMRPGVGVGAIGRFLNSCTDVFNVNEAERCEIFT